MTIPEPTAEDLARDAQFDHIVLPNKGDIHNSVVLSYLRRAVAAERERDVARKIINQTPSMDLMRQLAEARKLLERADVLIRHGATHLDDHPDKVLADIDAFLAKS